jgi:hypothetical protein
MTPPSVKATCTRSRPPVIKHFFRSLASISTIGGGLRYEHGKQEIWGCFKLLHKHRIRYLHCNPPNCGSTTRQAIREMPRMFHLSLSLYKDAPRHRRQGPIIFQTTLSNCLITRRTAFSHAVPKTGDGT